MPPKSILIPKQNNKMKKIITAFAAVMFTTAVFAQTKVSESRVWNFADKAHNEVIAAETIENNGLYIRGGVERHKIVAKHTGCTLTRADGAVFKAKVAAAQPGSKFTKNVTPTTKANAVARGTDDCYAFETSVPGRVSLIATPKKGQADMPGRAAVILFNGKEVARHDFTAEGPFELSYDAKTGGTFFLGANGSLYVYEISFKAAK